mgnify:FL=1
MAKLASSKRYAQAVFQIAEESEGQVGFSSWAEDLRILALSLENNDLVSLLNAPQIPTGTKLQTIDNLLLDSVSHLATNLLAVLATRNLAHILPDIADEFSRLVDEKNGIARGEVTSAIELTGKQNDSIEEILSKVIGKPIKLTTSVDSQIIGGIVARVGDQVIDGSIRTKLQEMRRSLVKQA